MPKTLDLTTCVNTGHQPKSPHTTVLKTTPAEKAQYMVVTALKSSSEIEKKQQTFIENYLI